MAKVKANGMTPMLELHWTHGQYTGNSAGCSDVHATCQKPMPGMQYTPSFRTSVACTFKDDPTVVLDLFNEPYPDRATCPGIAYSNDVSQWLTHKPDDPKNDLAAAWHVYNFNTCANESCWNSQLAPVAAHVPLVAGEIGENTCGHSFIDQVMKWFDDRGLSYLGWTWNTWSCTSGPALISGYDGTPTAYGIGLRDHLRSLDG